MEKPPTYTDTHSQLKNGHVLLRVEYVNVTRIYAYCVLQTFHKYKKKYIYYKVILLYIFIYALPKYVVHILYNIVLKFILTGNFFVEVVRDFRGNCATLKTMNFKLNKLLTEK